MKTKHLFFVMLVVLGFISAESAKGFVQEDQLPQPTTSSGSASDVAVVDVIRDVLVPAREPGILEKMLVKEGDWVQAGQVIAELDHRLYELELEAARLKHKISETKATDDIDTRYSTKSKEVANATLLRSESAVNKYPQSITATELEQLKLELERATLSIEKSEFDRKLSQYEADLNLQETAATEYKLSQRVIHSPIDGLVVEALPQQGEWLNAGQTIVRVVQLDRMRIKAMRPIDQIDQSFVGRRAVFISATNGEKYEGTIHFVSPEIFLGVQKIEFWFDVDNPDRKLRRREPGRVEILPPTG
jgi:multidrug efflux pump subunit AcrA (membrane-fusion protein)